MDNPYKIGAKESNCVVILGLAPYLLDKIDIAESIDGVTLGLTCLLGTKTIPGLI